MKDSEENIDKMMRDHFSDQSFGTPPQDFLDDLNQRLDQRDRGALFGPWNGLLDGILILLLVLIPIFDTTTLSNANLKQKSTAELQKEVSEKIYNVNELVERNDSILSSTVLKENKELDTTKNKIIQNKSDEAFNDAKTTKSSLHSHMRDLTSKDNFNRAKSEESNSLTATTSSKKADSKQTYKTNTNSEQESQSDNNLSQFNSVKLELSKVQDTSKNKVNKVESHYYEPSLVYASEYPIIESKIRNWDFPPISSSNSSILTQETDQDIKEVLSPISCEAQLFSGLNFPSLTSSTGLSGSNTLLNQQSGFAPSFSIGARLTMWYNNVAVTSGFDLLSIKEDNLFELNEIDSYDSTYVVNIDTTVTFDSVQQAWDTVYTYDYDSITVSDTTLNIIPVSQQYSWVQIPFQVGYKFQFNKWAIIPRAGINIALGIRQQNKSYPNEAFSQLQSYTPAAKVLMNLSGSLEVRRDINNWHIFARGGYQTGMQPILTGDYFERRYSGFRMNIGIGITLK